MSLITTLFDTIVDSIYFDTEFLAPPLVSGPSIDFFSSVKIWQDELFKIILLQPLYHKILHNIVLVHGIKNKGEMIEVNHAGYLASVV